MVEYLFIWYVICWVWVICELLVYVFVSVLFFMLVCMCVCVYVCVLVCVYVFVCKCKHKLIIRSESVFWACSRYDAFWHPVTKLQFSPKIVYMYIFFKARSNQSDIYSYFQLSAMKKCFYFKIQYIILHLKTFSNTRTFW